MKTTLAVLLLSLCLLSAPSYASPLLGRLGIGMTHQLANDVPALSLKIQKSRYTAIGAILGFKNDGDRTLYGGGLKFYRNIYGEPHLRFYMASTLAVLNFADGNDTSTGYQVDGNFGSEFHIPGIESIGFSFEFGLRAYRDAQNTVIQTMGEHILTAGVHFYL